MIKRIINLPLAVGSYTVGFAVVMTHLALAGRAERRLQLPPPPHPR
jgi:hypothetical protein